MKKRRVFRLRWSRDGFWHLSGAGRVEYGGCTKVMSIHYAARYASVCTPSQLVVHNKDGRIAFERTYGADPKRRKG